MDLENDFIYVLGYTSDTNFCPTAASFEPVFLKYHEASKEIYKLKSY